MFLDEDKGFMEPSLAQWRSGAKVEQGGECPGRQTVCAGRTMPTLQSLSSVLSTKQTLHFPLGLVAFAFFSGLIKVRNAHANDKESFMSHQNNEHPNRSAASA